MTEPEPLVHKLHPNDYWVGIALLWSAIAWLACAAAVVLHIAGAGTMTLDVVAVALSTAVGVAWCVVIAAYNW